MGVVTSAPASVWSLAAPLLEGPVWVARDAALWFVDTKGHRVQRSAPAPGAKRGGAAPGRRGSVLPAAGGGFGAGLQPGLARFAPADGSFTPLVDPEPERPGNRLNDATVDPAGRLWFGTMDDSEAADTGAIYRLAADGRCIAASPFVSITNGPAVSPDGRTLYHIDTLGGVIHACDLAADGSLANRREFARIPNEQGYPDGPTMDAEGCLWVGLYKGSAVRRYAPDGQLLETVRFPVAAIPKSAFAGPDLKTGWATTANKRLSPAEKAANPHAGDLFAFRVAVPGVAGTLIREGA